MPGIEPVANASGVQQVASAITGVAENVAKTVDSAVKARASRKAKKNGAGEGPTHAEKLELIDKITDKSKELDTHASRLRKSEAAHKAKLDAAAEAAKAETERLSAHRTARLARNNTFHQLTLASQFADYVKPGTVVRHRTAEGGSIEFTTPGGEE